MDRTLKVKIALGVTLVFLAVRMVLGLFPVPLEFAPYSPDGQVATLQKVTFTEITHAFSMLDMKENLIHYYWVTEEDGSKAAVCSRVLYKNERFEKPVTFTGVVNTLDPLENPAASGLLILPEGGNAGDYTEMQKMAVLNRDYTETTTDHPACIWVAAGGFLSFCVMLALLLKEYAGGKQRKRDRIPDEE
ncbi:MAG: hypothetical protein IJW34_04840 [Clostridia bacterium]|nr:hypothetical protein [Clostridia bacterium]